MLVVHRVAALAVLACGIATEAQAQLGARVYASGFASPVAFVQDPVDPTVQYVVQQGGRIRVVRSGTVLATDFLDLTSAVTFGGEQGLLGLAFAPDYPTSGRFFVNFTNTAGNTVVARFRRSADPLVADPASRLDLRWGGVSGLPYIAQPFANHKGGNLAFGPDGFLYIGLGDGGGAGDPGDRAQNPSELLGKMLRVDVSVPDSDMSGYSVPPDNPFIHSKTVPRPEIWSFGLRNPWRYSFDDPARGGTGALVMADVGQDAWEEIDYEPSNHGGRNYGWRVREGTHAYDTSRPPAFLPLTDPIYEYDHTVGQSIIGGYVYRGRALGGAYAGRYFFADFVRGRVWSLALTIDGAGEATASNLIEHTAPLGGGAQLGNISSFGIDAAGELYIVSYSRGVILKVGPTAAPPAQIVWRNSNNGQNVVWLMNGTNLVAATFTATIEDPNWEIKAVRDLNGDGQDDLVWRNKVTGQNIVWLMNGATLVEWAMLPDVPDLAWEIKTAGDLDGDGKADLVWRNNVTGENIVWLMDGLMIKAISMVTTVADLDWEIQGTGDLDGDGRADVIWRHKVTGANMAWLMNGTTVKMMSFLPAVTDLNWVIKALGHLNGDGMVDILWRNTATGNNVIWEMNGTIVAAWAYLPTVFDLNWEIEGAVDLDRDGRAEVVWRNEVTGENIVWTIAGLMVQTAVFVPSVADLSWNIVIR